MMVSKSKRLHESMKQKAKIDSAMVLAAGLGKRMRPISATTPKPLIRIGKRTLVNRALDRLAAAGVKSVIVNVHYLADLVEHHVLRRNDLKIVISDERDMLLETGGGTKKALANFDGQPFFLINTDTFWIESASSSLSRLEDFWDDTQMDALLLLSPTVNARGFSGHGDFDIDNEGRLSRRCEKKLSAWIYAGVAILNPGIFNDTPEGSFSLNVIFDRAIANKRLFGLSMDGIFVNVGTPAAIGIAEQTLQDSAV